ncbi:MAG: hypothetical protein IJ324_02625 [Lachnospiraceae bacterium]|nr:hypothetical protein [Lachnospiraceae bacterium]
MFIYDNEFEKKELLLGLGTTSPEDKVEDSLTEINQMIDSLGIRFIHDTTAGGESILKIQFDTKKIEKNKKRGAGRPRNYRTSTFSYGDIYKWRSEGKTTKEIIETLHCSRATYYRRLKEAKDWNTSEDTRWLG